MPKVGKNASRRLRRRGTVVIYVAVTLLTLMAVSSLAVDYGRVVEIKSELRRAVDASARAACAQLMPFNSPTLSGVQTTATKMMAQNLVNGGSVTLLLTGKTPDVQIGTWSAKNGFVSTSSIASANAVQITASLTAAKGNAVGLYFGKILGANTCNVTAKAVAFMNTATWSPSSAKLPTTDSKGNSIVSAHSNLWLAGQSTKTEVEASAPMEASNLYNQTTLANQDPNINNRHNHPWEYDISGTYGGGNSYGEPYETPAEVDGSSFTLVGGATITVSNVSGTATNVNAYSGSPDYTADGSENGTYRPYSDVAATDPGVSSYTGDTNTGNTFIGKTKYTGVSGTEHGIANITAPLNSLLGVFLDAGTKAPDADSGDKSNPTGFDFTSQNARDYSLLEPSTKQPFYIGNGETSSQQQQTIVVPMTATNGRFFLGTMDGQEWSNNQGGYSMTISEYWITLVK